MDTQELDRLIGELTKLEQSESNLEIRSELTGIRERMAGLRQSPLLSGSARGVLTPEARRALGLDEHGFVDAPETMQSAIQSMAESFKTARLDHDAKKDEIAEFLATVWGDPKGKKTPDAQHLLSSLETTRRLLIALKKYLARHNAKKADGERDFRLSKPDETVFKDAYYGLVAKARVHEHVIHRSGLHRNIKITRVYYDSSDSPLVSDLDQRWATMWDPESPDLLRVHQHNVTSGDTIDYLPRAEEIVLLFYPRDVRERWAFSGRRSKPTRGELEQQLDRTGFKLSDTRAAQKKGDFKLKAKLEQGQKLLQNMLALAGTTRPLAPTGQSRGEHALLNRTLSLYIRDARIHISELLATYERKYTVTEYVGRVKSLGKDISDVARRITEWTERYESLIEQIVPMWELADARAKIKDDEAYKAQLLPALRALITKFAGGRVWDMAYTEVREGESPSKTAPDTEYETTLGSWRKAYEADLAEAFGKEEAQRLPRDLPIMDVMCMWLFAKHIPAPPKGGEPMPVSVFYWLWKEGHFESGGASLELLLPYEIDWEAMVKALPREECEQVHDVAIRVWEVEMFELCECIRWAEGNVEERRTANWIEHGNAIADYIARANGVIAFVDTHEACFDKMEKFINWVLFPKHELGRSEDYEHLAVGSGVVNFQVSISLEASLFSRISAGVTLSYQYSGKIAQDDDRRVRWTGKHSFNLSIKADAKLTLADVVETQTALDLLKASVAAGKELYSAVSVAVFESPRHLAAVWAEDLANARYILTTPVNGINTPGGFKRFRGVPRSETEREILAKVVGGKGKLSSLSELLQRPRIKARRAGLSDYESDWTLSAELEAPLVRAKAERLAHAKSVMHFSRKILAELEQPKERYATSPIVHTWSKNLYAFPFVPAKLDSADLGFSWTEIVEPGPDNPLDLYPESSTEPPTTELLGGFLEADNGSFDVGFTHIHDHPNPDNDGMYLNIKSSRNWGVGLRTGDVSFGFQRTQQWMAIDRNKLRFHFNYMVEACREFFQNYREEDGSSSLPDLDPQDGDDPGAGVNKEELNDLVIGHIRRHNVKRVKKLSWYEGQPLLHSRPGSSMLWRMRAMSLFGNFELNFIYNADSGFEVQYGRVWVTNKIVLGYSASLPPFPFLKVGAEIAGEMSLCCFETLGLYTLSYILTVYNGCRKRLDPEESQTEWKAWVREHREELHALFNKLADPSCNTYTEVNDATGAPGKLGSAATELLELCNVEIAKHIPPVLPKGPSKARSGKIALSPSTKSKPTVLGGGDFGVISLKLSCHTGWHRSTAWYRRGPKPRVHGEHRRGKLISQSTHPIFVVRPGNSYDIEFTLDHPKRIKVLELDVFNDKGASVLAAPWTLDATALPELFDTAKPTAPEKRARFRGRLRWFGSKDGALAKGKIAGLNERELDGAAGLPPIKNPGFYCMVLSVKEATAGPPEGALAWTYFTVLDDPLAALERFLAASGAEQDSERKPRWSREKASEQTPSSDTPSSDTPSSSSKQDESRLPTAVPGREQGKATPPKVAPPPPREPRAVVEGPRTPEIIMGIQNLGRARGYTCYINSALQLLIHAGLLPRERNADLLTNPDLARSLLAVTDAYEVERLTGAEYWPSDDLDTLVALRQSLRDNNVITQLREEDDAAAVLFELLQACGLRGGDGRPSPLHFELRVNKSYRPGASTPMSDEELAHAIVERVALRDDDTTEQLQSHNHVQLGGLPSARTSLTDLWAANWDADVSGDNPSVKYRGNRYYPLAQPLRQTIAFSGAHPNPMLVLLKRFVNDGLGGATRKIETPIDVDLRPTIHGRRYRLVGFIEHIGASLSTGHYVVYLRKHHAWWRCSDSVVQAISGSRLEARVAQGYVYCFRPE